MASEHKPGRMPVLTSGNGTGLYLEPGAVPSKSRLEVFKDPQSGRPIGIQAPDEDTIRAFAEKHDARVQGISHEPATTERAAIVRRPLFSREIEIAALKSALLTFDDLLRNDPDPFTRSECVKPVRSAICECVMNESKADGLLRDVVWGVDYVAAAQMQVLVDEQLPQFASHFQHILIATGNAAARTLDLVWAVLGFEALRFRLSDRWRGNGADFTHVFACGVLRDSHPSPLERLHEPFYMGRRSAQCSCPVDNISRGGMAELLENRTHYHLIAIAQATELVEMTSDEMVRLGLHSITSLVVAQREQPGLVTDGLRLRFSRMFEGALSRQEDQTAFDEIVSEKIETLDATQKEQTIARSDDTAGHVDWGAWIAFDREVYQDLKVAFGLPKGVKVEHIDIQKLDK